ncbi:hypothetical protein ARHIZOSPH14_21300 [Agromyces rhizosphaerae]|uniref:Multicopper oxidase domain-containing protein n=1 Tax=Agromyces rhizosphaerae TaxID=88374 RepID=A0A9W6FS84_9MICO|nr:hypothetical protein ARHIZOSPH14_21300 [Agromyces rhizosphaerae]
MLALGAVGVGAVAVGGTALVVANLGSEAPEGTDQGASDDATSSPAGATGWHEPEVIESVDGVLDLDLELAPADVVLGGTSVRMLAYNGTVPGPTLHLRPGDLLRVRLRNGLDEPTNLHTHGLVVSAAENSDNPFVHIAPGDTFDYEIALPDDHPVGVCWYHPHHHGMVTDQLFAGLYGAIVVDDEDWAEVAPRIVVVSDTTIADGAVATVSRAERMLGRTGETLLTNGGVAPELAAPPGEDQRLLIVNACASRYLDLRFDGLGARLRGLDSGHLAESPADRLVLAPGNRADMVVTVPDSATAVTAVGYDRGGMGMGMMSGASTVAPDAVVLTVVPDAAAPAPSVADATPESHPDLRDAAIDGTRALTMEMSAGAGAGGMRFLIDGREFAPGRVDQQVRIGTVEEWTIENTSPMDHPFHLHIWPMQVVREGGGEVPGLDLRDVVDVPAGGAVTVRIAFDRFPGRTVYHCHILDHEDLGMMGVIEAG